MYREQNVDEREVRKMRNLSWHMNENTYQAYLRLHIEDLILEIQLAFMDSLIMIAAGSPR
jgi:hypothetical protein